MRRLIIILATLLLVSCADDSIYETQATNIENYLTLQFGNGETYDGYLSDGVYRYIGGNALSENEQTLLGKGDAVSIWFEGYTFRTAPISLFFTNKEDVADSLGIDTSTWSNDMLEALQFRIGDNVMLSAVENALIGCLRGDSVQIFITSDHGYGDHAFGSVPQNTPLMFKIEIE